MRQRRRLSSGLRRIIGTPAAATPSARRRSPRHRAPARCARRVAPPAAPRRRWRPRRCVHGRPVDRAAASTCATSPPAAASPAQAAQAGAAELEVVLRRLAEADAGIEHDALARHATPRASAPRARAQEGRDFRHHVVVVRLLLHRRAARPACASGRRRRWDAPPPASTAPGALQGLHVVDDVGARSSAARITAACACPPTPGNPACTRLREHRQTRFAALPRRGTGCGAGPASIRRRCRGCRRPRCSSRSQWASAGRCARRPAVGEGVGRHVDDAHHPRARRGRSEAACVCQNIE